MFILILAVVTAILILSTVLLDKKRPLIFYFTKPITTLAIISVVVTAIPQNVPIPTYAVWILTGLGFSLVGDIALMFDSSKAFLLGLGSFFVAHACYLSGMWISSGLDWFDSVILVILIGTNIGVYQILKEKLGEMKIPVILYMIIILFMVERAISAPLGINSSLNFVESILLAGGASLFWLSDLVLSLHLFHKPNPHVGIMNLVPYFIGQLLIAMSARLLLIG